MSDEGLRQQRVRGRAPVARGSGGYLGLCAAGGHLRLAARDACRPDLDRPGSAASAAVATKLAARGPCLHHRERAVLEHGLPAFLRLAALHRALCLRVAARLWRRCAALRRRRQATRAARPRGQLGVAVLLAARLGPPRVAAVPAAAAARLGEG